jgi:hypothetical protein
VLRGAGVLRRIPREGSPSRSQCFIAPAILHSARQIFIARCASRTPIFSSWVAYQVSTCSSVTILGRTSPNDGSMYFQPRSQSSRVRGF